MAPRCLPGPPAKAPDLRPGIRRPVATIGKVSDDGIPYLAPEIQLFCKARGRRPKDETDFAAVLPLLDSAQRQWLSDALTRTL